MTTLLLILLGFALISVLFVGITTLVLFNRMKKNLQHLDVRKLIPPFRVSLQPVLHPESSLSEGFLAAAQHLSGRSGEVYTIQQLPGTFLQAYTCAAGFLVLQQHPANGVFIDAVAKSESGQWFTVSTNPEQGIKAPGFTTKIYLNTPDISADQVQRLLSTLQEITQGEALVSWSLEDFKDVFETVYALEMDWHALRGGPTTEEICRVARLNGDTAPDTQSIQVLQEQWKVAINLHMETLIFESLLKQNCPPELQQDLENGELLCVHALSETDQLAYAFCDALDINNDTQYEAHLKHFKALFENTEHLPQAFYAAQQEHLGAAKRVYQLVEPIEVDIYKGLV